MPKSLLLMVIMSSKVKPSSRRNVSIPSWEKWLREKPAKPKIFIALGDISEMTSMLYSLAAARIFLSSAFKTSASASGMCREVKMRLIPALAAFLINSMFGIYIMLNSNLFDYEELNHYSYYSASSSGSSKPIIKVAIKPAI